MEHVIETFSLTKVFSDWWGRDKVRAVDDLNLKIKSNEVYGLLGPNGSGKTTTIKMVLGLLHPTKGNCLVLGGDSKNPKINSKIGFLPEESYLYKYLNARETLNFYGRLFGLPAKVRKSRIEALLDMVGLKAVANRPVGTYSKGMARRIGLAQALINDPDLLILDEPTTGLDPLGTRQIKDLIDELSKRGKTILLCSHLLADVEDVCDRISILYGGKIQSEGKVEELLKQAEKTEITASHLSENAIEKIKKIIQEENGNDIQVSSPMEKLETFFVRTITDAQKKKATTSGAYSTKQIGDFLSGSEDKESILDKLVSSDVEEEKTVKQPETEETKAVTQEPEVKESMLSDLAGEKTTQVEPEEENNEEEEQGPEAIEEDVKKDLLKDLTEEKSETETDSTQSGRDEEEKDA